MNLIVNIVLPLAVLVSMNIRIYRTMKGQFWYRTKRDQVRFAAILFPIPNYFGPINALGGLIKARFCNLSCYHCAEIYHLGLHQHEGGRTSPGRRLFKILYKKIFRQKITYAC